MSAPGTGLRPSMAWLHTWGGLWFCWLLYAIFLTGTLAVMEEPITHWMTPEHHAEEARQAAVVKTAPLADRPRSLAHAVAYLQREQPPGEMWEIWPGSARHGNDLTVYWMEKGAYIARHLDPLSGKVIADPHDDHDAGRATLGGHHFVDFHYTLHAGTIGLWIVGAATLAMLVTLVSGVITHKRIFRDFFTFRASKGQRSWLDGHTAAGVLSLPFQFMIALTGIFFYGNMYMPAATWAEPAMGGARVEASSASLLAIPDLEPFARRGETLMKQDLRAIVIDKPGQPDMRISTYGWNDDEERQERLVGTTAMVSFSADGKVLETRPAGKMAGGSATYAIATLAALHMAEFGGFTVKWLYFIGGLAGTAMMGTGAILFMVKRRGRAANEFGRATPQVYRLIEALNIAAIAGLAVASIAYLWANRLIATDIAHREDWEVGVFFVVWLMAFSHALIRSPGPAWREQWTFFAFLCLALPLVNLLTVGDMLPMEVVRGDWESAGLELVALVCGAASWWALHRLKRRTTASMRAPSVRDVAPVAGGE